MSISGGDLGETIPDEHKGDNFIKRLADNVDKILAALGGTEFYGVTFLDNPVGWTIGLIINWLIGLVMSAAGAVGYVLNLAWSQLIGSLESAGYLAIVAPARGLSSGITSFVEDTLEGVSAMVAQLGPLAPFATVALLAVAVWIGVSVLEVAIRQLRRALQL